MSKICLSLVLFSQMICVILSWVRAWDCRLREDWNCLDWGFPGSSASRDSSCNAGDPGLIPGSGRSPEEGIGYPLQYSWASLVAEMIKNPSSMRKTWVQSLGWECLLEGVMATHSSILAWRIPVDRGAWRTTVHRVAKNQTQLNTQFTPKGIMQESIVYHTL